MGITKRVGGFCAILSLSFLISFNSHATIYGVNDFKEVLLSSDARITEASRSVAVQVRNLSIVIDAPFNSRTLKQSLLCENEKFINQPIISNCTGFLIAPDLLLTAGHCMADSECKKSSWMFDYASETENPTSFSGVKDNIYSCSSVVKVSYESKLDYAVVKLDRPVSGNRSFLPLSSKPVINRQKLVQISAPRGLPLKESKGRVRNTDGDNYFTSNLDSMRGSSGGPIFDAKTMEVVGIVAQGDVDYDFNGECQMFKVCGPDECRGEDATRISEVLVDYLAH